MKSKILLFLFVAFLLSLAFVSSATSFSATSSATITKTQNASITITPKANGTINVPASIDITDNSKNLTINLSPSGSAITITNGTDTKINLLRGVLVDDFKYGTYTNNVIIKNSINSSDNQTVTVEFVNGFCDFGEKGNSTRRLVITSVEDQSSDDEWEWKPLDNVEVEVEVEFTSSIKDDDDVDVILELGLYDTKEGKFLDLGDDKILENDLSIEEGDEESVSFNLEIPADVEKDSSGRYKLMIKAYEDDEENTLCADYADGRYFRDIKIEKESYDVALDDISATDEVPCEGDLQVTTEVFNIGSNDEDKVYVHLFNKELGLNLNSREFSLDSGDSEDITFNFAVPKDATEKNYTVVLAAYYRYRKSSETYREVSKNFYKTFAVSGNCFVKKANLAITVEYNKDTPKAIAGKEVLLNAVINNTGSAEDSFTLEIMGNEAWSSVKSVTPKTIKIAPGTSQTVVIGLNIDENAEAGSMEFKIKATSATSSLERRVQITIEDSDWQNLIKEHLTENWFIYLIILINVVLIIVIIALVVRFSRA